MPRNDRRRAELVALRRVVVDDVEDHLDAGAVHRLDEPLELAHLLPMRPRRGVAGVRREEADRRVAPVVRQSALLEKVLVGDVVDRQQLHCRDTKVDEMRNGGVRGEPGVGAAEIVANSRHQLRETLDMELVDHASRSTADRRADRPPSRTPRRSRPTSGSPPHRRSCRSRGRRRPRRRACVRDPTGQAPRSPSRRGRSEACAG